MSATRTKTPASNGGPPPEGPTVVVAIDPIDVERLRVPIVGTSPLIMHRFSEKAKRQMLDAMQGRKTPKQPKDPEAEYLAAFYRFEPSGYGHPAIAFKDATVSAARFYDKSVTMTGLRQCIWFIGEIGADGIQLVRVDGEPQMREDVVRVGNKGADLRYRPEFRQWAAVLDVTYVRSALTRNSVLSLIDAGGMGVGVGEWRPEKGGDFGTYRVDSDRDAEALEIVR
jgi:hypothetical protein